MQDIHPVHLYLKLIIIICKKINKHIHMYYTKFYEVRNLLQKFLLQRNEILLEYIII